jgi:hypothetical protein
MKAKEKLPPTWVLCYGGLTNKVLNISFSIWLLVVVELAFPDSHHNTKPQTVITNSSAIS